MADDTSDAVKNAIAAYTDMNDMEKADFHSTMRSNKHFTTNEALLMAKQSDGRAPLDAETAADAASRGPEEKDEPSDPTLNPKKASKYK